MVNQREQDDRGKGGGSDTAKADIRHDPATLVVYIGPEKKTAAVGTAGP